MWYPDVWVGEWVKNLGIKGIFGEILERLVLFFGKNAKFIAISESTKRKLIKNGIPEKNIVVIPCGIDEYEIEKIKKVIRTKKYDLVAVNRLVKYKQTEMVVKAALDKNLSLLIIGYGPEKENLNKLIIANHGQDKIKIISGIKKHTDLLTAMTEAKIYVCASCVEGFGIAAVEASSIGLPCVLFNNPAFAEIAKSLKGIITFKNMGELKFNIDKVINNNSMLNQLNQKNIQSRKLYFWKTIVESTTKFYKKVF